MTMPFMVNRVAGENCDAGELVSAVVNMRIHHKFSGHAVVNDFWPFQDPAKINWS